MTDWWKADLRAQSGGGSVGGATITKTSQSIDDYESILDQFLAFIRESADCQVIILYKPFTELTSDGTIAQSCDDASRELFSRFCGQHGIVFVDASEVFARLYEEHHVLAHGFSNTAVGVGHLNRYGHEAIGELLAETIKEVQ